MPAALAFVVFGAIVVWRERDLVPVRAAPRTVVAGAAGGAVIVGAAAAGRQVLVGLTVNPSALAWWLPLVAGVAVVEELLLRGALFTALSRARGDGTALVVTSLLFGLMHIPLYGWIAVPLDCAVGLFLGALRLLTRSVVAPAVAHVVADVAAAVVTS